MTDIFHCNLEKSKGKEEVSEKEDDDEESKRGLKRKLDGNEGSEDQGGNSQRENEQSPGEGKLKKAKNVGFFLADPLYLMHFWNSQALCLFRFVFVFCSLLSPWQQKQLHLQEN